jgi:hypothetical protein
MAAARSGFCLLLKLHQVLRDAADGIVFYQKPLCTVYGSRHEQHGSSCG